MTERRRRARVLPIAFGAAMLFGTLWAASACCAVVVQWQLCFFEIAEGRLCIAERRTPAPLHFEITAEWPPVLDWGFRWNGRHIPFQYIIVPLWAPTLLATGAAVLLWRSAHLARDAHLCPNCGYDLSGLATGAACSECGIVVPSAAGSSTESGSNG